MEHEAPVVPVVAPPSTRVTTGPCHYCNPELFSWCESCHRHDAALSSPSISDMERQLVRLGQENAELLTTLTELKPAEVLTPGITVCIATHPARQTSGLINRALASVAAQTLQPRQILVLNDVDREGVGVIRQRLLDKVTTQWLAWIDSDDEWFPEHLEKLMRVATETDSVWVHSYFQSLVDPLGHFGLPFNPCTPHHTTITVLCRTDIAKEVGFPPSSRHGGFSNEDWAWITGFAALACERGLKMTHLTERTWNYHMGHGNSCGLPGQGDA